jgi:hypothetical protein
VNYWSFISGLGLFCSVSYFDVLIVRFNPMSKR